jgi:hypothetical protein
MAFGGSLIATGSPETTPPPIQLTSAEAVPATALPSIPIERIALGQRVEGVNPIHEQVENGFPEPDPTNWRALHLQMTKDDGQLLQIELLRPLEWLELVGAEVGATVYLDLAEMGAEGEAYVEAILPCPTIEPGAGTVVTGRFIHVVDSADVINLSIEGQLEPTGVTANHPYWSADREDFIPAGELRIGEQVDTIVGLRRVTGLAPRPGPPVTKVYNLETLEHVYRVGELGALVHNAYPLTTLQKSRLGSAARYKWEKYTGRSARSVGMDVHHRVPLEWAHKFPGADPNRLSNVVGIQVKAHQTLINAEWTVFRNYYKNIGKDPTAAQVMKKALDIDAMYGYLFKALR